MYSIVEVRRDNLAEHPQVICFINPKHEHYSLKIDWLKKRFKEGLKIKLLYVEGEKAPAGYIEYVPGEYAWRAVEAAGFLFIHCLWVYAKENRSKGFGSALIDDVRQAAKRLGQAGVAAVASRGPFMADPDVFLKNGFAVADESGPHQLLVNPYRPGRLPKFADWTSRLRSYRGWNIVYSKQCPWVARFVEDIKSASGGLNIRVKIQEIKTAAEAQKAPSVYSVFNLINDGRLLADHYISMTRFMNIVKKETRPGNSAAGKKASLPSR